MRRGLTTLAWLGSTTGMLGQTPVPRPKFDAFEVATIKQVEPNKKADHYILMKGVNRFVEKDFTLKQMIAWAYDLNPRAVSGGPGWMESDHFEIEAVTPGDVRPNHDEQRTMLQNLLSERFRLTFHRELKEFSIYELRVAKGGPKLKPSAAPANAPPSVVSMVYPGRMAMPARNVGMGDLVSVMQRAWLDRPVVDKTGLTGRYDFDLEWAPDETQFGGEISPAPADSPIPPLFTALEQQLGLMLVATRGPVSALTVDRAERPSAN